MEEVNIAQKEPSESKKKEGTNIKKPSHPPIAKMVDTAISTLHERGGSSLRAIKKYLAANFTVNADRIGSFIRKYIKNSLISGHLIQTTGRGVAGSFKLSAGDKKPGKNAANKAEKKKATIKKSDKKPPKSEKKKTTTSKETDEKAEVEKASDKETLKVKKSAEKKAKAPKPEKSEKPRKPVKTAAVKPKKKQVEKQSKEKADK